MATICAKSEGFDVVGPPAFTPAGDTLAFVAVKDEQFNIVSQNLATGDRAKLGEDLAGPANLSFSPDGKWLAFTMPVAYEPDTMGDIPTAPEGAKWAPPLVVETRHMYTLDGAGYLPFSSHQVFLISTEGGVAQQLTEGRTDYASALTWLPDSSALLLSANIKSDVNRPLDTTWLVWISRRVSSPLLLNNWVRIRHRRYLLMANAWPG